MARVKLTNAEALQRTCPYSMAVPYMTDTSGPEIGYTNVAFQPNSCQGAKCMAWCYAGKNSRNEDTGFCSAFGASSWPSDKG